MTEPRRNYTDSDRSSVSGSGSSDNSDTDHEIPSTLSESSSALSGENWSDPQSTSSDNDKQAGYSSDLSEDEQPVCQGSSIKRKTFEATFLALSNKHKFSKSTKNDILKFMAISVPGPNLPSSNYMFEKKFFQEMNIHYTRYELCIKCNTNLDEGKCQNGNCVHFNRKLNDREIEVCYFIPVKDQIQRILAGIIECDNSLI